jgi:hypothetical protein
MADQYQMGIKVPTTTQVSVPGGPVGYIPTWTPPTAAATADATPAVTGTDDAAKTKTDTTPTKSWDELERDRLEGLRRKNAAATIGGLMQTYGLGALMGKIDAWISEGYEPGAIEALIRQEPEYAARFPAMKQLQAKGQTMTEQQYIEYEQSMTAYESLYGLPKGMLSDKDMVTKLLVAGKSPREVDENAQRASASMYQLPQEFRDTMQRYYGVDSGGLTAYFLDPDVASPLLEKQYVSAQIGMEAWRQKVDIGASLSEELYKEGINREKAAAGFGKVADQSGLSAGKGETASQGTLIDANLRDSAGARKQVERVAGGRVAGFEGGGAFAGDKQGVRGIGSASA